MLEFDDFGDFVLAARALINALIITLAADKNRDEVHWCTKFGHRGDAIEVLASDTGMFASLLGGTIVFS